MFYQPTQPNLTQGIQCHPDSHFLLKILKLIVMKTPYQWNVIFFLSFLFIGASLIAQNQTSTKSFNDQAVLGVEKVDFLQQLEAEQKARMEDLHQAQMQKLEQQFQLEKQKHPYKGQKTSESDSLALVALYNATNGDNWTNNDNWLTGPVGTWYGVTLDGDNVSQLNLTNNNLDGQLSSEIGNLINLTYLSLWNNQLSGSIPTELGNLINITQLDLDVNHLSGSIPNELGNLINIQIIYLSNNQLTGNIPPELGDLSNITYLFLHNNQLTGSIPPELGNLSNLVYLYLHTNQLS